MNKLVIAVSLAALAWPSACPSGAEHRAGFRTRAVWVTRWAFKEPGDVRDLYAGLDAAGVNTVFFQVRGACDALYRSSYEPWSALLTGSLGTDPGWDPLAVAIDEGHKRGMEVHAWINVFTAWAVSDSGDPPAVSRPLHVYHAHPEWIARDATGRVMPLVRAETEHNYAFLSPTHDGVQNHIARVVSDLVGRYEIDGLHLDYVRFPDSTYSYDADTKAAYKLDMILPDVGQQTLPFSQWRARKLSDFVGRLARIARTARPGVSVTAALWQKLNDGRDIYLQDGVEWVRRGDLDYAVPMLYTPSVETFRERLGTFVELVGAEKVVAGLGPYLEAFTDSVLRAELDAAQASDVRGYSIFNSDFALKYTQTLTNYK